ncbi:hypothetical protein FKP32DRAFT_1674509 [Trametes sanguinea]|nr:hypothetical protein FKP32DRAFT_1674509 [Trametes sanguinea]
MPGGFRSRIREHGQEFRATDRVARLIVFPRYVPLLDRLREHPEDVCTMIAQITECLDALFHRAGILHRDVSAYNIMWQPPESPDSQPVSGNFVLCDFDLAVNLGSDNPSSSSETSRVATAPHRTGTLPFLALELLKNDGTPHRLYHDYESLFWVVLWCAMKVDYRDKNADRAAIDKILHGWQSTDSNRIYYKKRKVLETRCQGLPLSQRFKSSMRTTFLLESLSSLLDRAQVDGRDMQIEEKDGVLFGAKARSWGDIMDGLICKKTIMEALEAAAKRAEWVEARKVAARSQPLAT